MAVLLRPAGEVKSCVHRVEGIILGTSSCPWRPIMMRAGSLLAFLLFINPLTAAPTPSLKEYAVKLQGRHTYGVYIKEHKVGWMINEAKLGKYDGKDVLIWTEELRAEMKRDKSSVKMELKEKSVFSLTGNGDLLFHEESNKEGKAETIRRGVRRGDKFFITVSSEPDRERSVAPPRRNLLQTRQLDDWLRSGPKVGAKFETWSMTYEENDINIKEENTYKAKKTLTIGGVPTDIYHVQTKAKGAISDMEM